MPSKPHDIDVTVTFATADRPYHHKYAEAVAIGTVLGNSLAAFGIATGGTTRYYLKHDGDEVPVDKTVGEIAGHAHALHLKLRTELIQGAS
jgi:nicotinate-nucleotide pyrophosphorylase